MGLTTTKILADRMGRIEVSAAMAASDLAAKLLSEAHVVVVPGEAFGTDEHIRLSYAVSHDVVDEGVKRMREYFATLG